MKKKLIAFKLTVILTLSVFALTLVSVSSATYVEDGDWKFEKPSTNAQEYYIAGYKGTSDQARIPSLFQSKPVTKINNNTFLNNSLLTYVEIPLTVKSIGMNAFYCCTKLESAIISSSVTEIGANAFYGCIALKHIEFSADTSLTEIPRNCFSGCTSLQDATIPKGIKTISDRAFYNCTNLRDIIIIPSVTSISPNAFEGNEKMRILGWNFTYAQQYAEANNIPFISLGDHAIYPTTTTSADEVVPTTVTVSSSQDELIPTTITASEPITISNNTTATVPSSTTVPGTVYIIGDADLSGKVTVKDATAIQKYAADLAPLNREQLFLSNCDGVGGVNVKDATQIQKYCADFKNILFVGTEVIF